MSYKKVTVIRYECHCEKCDHNWTTKDNKVPGSCGKCKSKYWNKKEYVRRRKK